MTNYSNFRAFKALVRASLQSILKSPSAIVFGIAFPLIFILVFGLLGGGTNFTIHVISSPDNDTTTGMYSALHQVPVFKWEHAKDTVAINKLLSEGDASAVIKIEQQPEGIYPRYKILLRSAPSELVRTQRLEGIIKQIIINMDPQVAKKIEELASIKTEETQIREFKTIDFILPGQLGFSLLAGSVFGTAFVFFNLRQTLVLKRFFATPVRREIIVLSEATARMLFQIVSTIIIISIGYFVFNYTLINGWITFFELLIMSIIAIMVFMGFGFTVSGIAKSESTIPPFSNLITLPQFLLAGTFFPVDNFPKWMQPFCKALPLTFFNNAMRKIAFDGANLWEVKTDILFLLLWGVIIYFIASRVFKWE